MSGKRKYTEKTFAKKAKALQDLDSGMSVRACAAKYSISVGTIVNWKKNKSKIISFISEFTSLSQKDLRESAATARSQMKEFTNGLLTLIVETFSFLAQFCKSKLYKWRPTLV
jgi:hypothetical protein